MIRRPPRSTLSSSSAASDVYKRQADARPGLMKRMSRWVLHVSAAGPLPYGRGSVTKHTAPDRAATVREQLAGLIREIRKLVSPSPLTTLCRWAALAAGLVLLRSVRLPDLPLS